MNFEAILGPAGTGKTTLLRERSAIDPNYCKLTASTGIAAVNLGPSVTTVNSALGFYNLESAIESLESGRFRRRFLDLAEQGYKNLVIDEVSMMSAELIDTIAIGAAQGAVDVLRRNKQRGTQLTPVGLILTGDFCQLPPVNAPFGFNSAVWPRIELGMTHLKTVYRQTNPGFLDALNNVRAGKGTTATMKLSQCGVKFVGDRDDFFDGLSLVPTNAIADKINQMRFATIESPIRQYKSTRWGKEGSEWNSIPDVLELKEGALVMILANEPQTFEYVNGDQGVILEMGETAVVVEIRRGEKKYVKEIPLIWRETVQAMKPDGVEEYSGFLVSDTLIKLPREIEAIYKSTKCEADDETDEGKRNLMLMKANRLRARQFGEFYAKYDAYVNDAIKSRQPFYSCDKQKWVIGWIEYMPIRLSWASTIHKSQGLTLDRIQIDARSRFAGSPGMMYVALSRCREPENIRVVCGIADFPRRIQTAKECLRWV